MVPTSTRSSFVSSGTLCASGMWSSSNSRGVLTSIRQWLSISSGVNMIFSGIAFSSCSSSTCSDGDDAVGFLHTGDDFEHIRDLADLYFVEQVKKSQAGAARRDLNPTIGKLQQDRHRLGTFRREADAAVDEGNAPEIGPHLFQGFQKIEHQHVAQAIVAMPHMRTGDQDHDLLHTLPFFRC